MKRTPRTLEDRMKAMAPVGFTWLTIEVEGENLKECIKIIREEAEAGFPNVNEHGEYNHHIIKEEAS